MLPREIKGSHYTEPLHMLGATSSYAPELVYRKVSEKVRNVDAFDHSKAARLLPFGCYLRRGAC